MYMTILKIENLALTLPNGRQLYQNFSVNLDKGQGLMIYGATGSGKTTLTKLLLGLNNNYQGRIEVLGQNLSKLNSVKLTELRSQIGFQLEEPLLFDDLNLLENLTMYLKINKSRIGKRQILSILYEHGFSGLQKKKISSLSWGEQRMIEMLRIVLKAPALVICDQPFAALDQDKKKWMAARLNGLVASGSAVLMTYSLSEVRKYMNWPEIKLEES